MNNQPIGILDSGVGGLTVWKEILKALPHESTIYIGDSLNAPYGARKKEEILHLASKMIDFLLTKQVKLIVVACNTITVSGIDVLRKKYPKVPIIGAVPVIKTAVKISKTGKIGVLSTVKTAESEYQKSLIAEFAKGCDVLNLGTNRLVPLIEKGEIEGEELQKILEKELEPFKKAKVDVLALGCTHFPFLTESITKILGKEITLLDSGSAIARQVGRVLEHNNTLATQNNLRHIMYTTGDKKIMTILSEKPLTVKKVTL